MLLLPFGLTAVFDMLNYDLMTNMALPMWGDGEATFLYDWEQPMMLEERDFPHYPLVSLRGQFSP